MKNLIRAAGFAGVMGLAAGAGAQTTVPGADPAKPGPEVIDPSGPDQMEGMHERMDHAGHKRATIEGRIEDLEEDEGRVSIELRAQDDVQVMRDGKSVSFRELEEGDSVRASYDEQTGRIVEIEATSPERRRKMREAEQQLEQ